MKSSQSLYCVKVRLKSSLTGKQTNMISGTKFSTKKRRKTHLVTLRKKFSKDVPDSKNSEKTSRISNSWWSLWGFITSCNSLSNRKPGSKDTIIINSSVKVLVSSCATQEASLGNKLSVSNTQINKFTNLYANFVRFLRNSRSLLKSTVTISESWFGT